MSFLSLLLVASAFYFAHARPDSQTWPEAPGGVQTDIEEGLETTVAPEPITDPSDDQHKLFAFMQELRKSVDYYMTPLMLKLDLKKQDELKSMCMNGMASYINYVDLIIEDIIQGQADGDPLPRADILVEFEYDYPLAPDTLIAAT